jgi:hypothetical protein
LTDYDSPWKEALVYLFGDFLEFYFPAAPPDIDWSRSQETLDKELQQVLRDSKSGKRVVDHLVKVWLKNGQEEWLLIHVEIQAQADPEFLARLYAYNTRIFDIYQRDVVTFVILADESDTWRPAVYEFDRWGFQLRMEFPTVKLRDLVRSRGDLETCPNPFAALTLAHVRTQETKNDAEARRAWKFRLVRGLYKRGMNAEAVRRLFRCIDWMMNLPKEQEDLFWDDVIQLQKENKMPFIDIATRKGMEQGMEQGKGQGLVEAILLDWEIKFNEIDETARQEIEAIHDLNLLRHILRAGKSAASLEELRKIWKPA